MAKAKKKTTKKKKKKKKKSNVDRKHEFEIHKNKHQQKIVSIK
jgi:hypothetical protein